MPCDPPSPVPAVAGFVLGVVALSMASLCALNFEARVRVAVVFGVGAMLGAAVLLLFAFRCDPHPPVAAIQPMVWVP
jgi:hypothetical protein